MEERRNKLSVAPMTVEEWPAVRRIYQAGIDTGNATFAPAPSDTWEAWQAGKLNACSLVARDAAGGVVGWAALSPVSTRHVYRGVAEVSVYVDPVVHGQGVGSRLMQALIEVSEAEGMWTLQASIFPENTASLALHARHGFRVVGHRERIGYMAYGPWAGQWRDTLFMERRSVVVGV